MYFRYHADQTVMVVMNPGSESKTFKTGRFTERTSGFNNAKNIVTADVHDLKAGNWTIPAETIWVLELQK